MCQLPPRVAATIFPAPSRRTQHTAALIDCCGYASNAVAECAQVAGGSLFGNRVYLHQGNGERGLANGRAAPNRPGGQPLHCNICKLGFGLTSLVLTRRRWRQMRRARLNLVHRAAARAAHVHHAGTRRGAALLRGLRTRARPIRQAQGSLSILPAPPSGALCIRCLHSRAGVATTRWVWTTTIPAGGDAPPPGGTPRSRLPHTPARRWRLRRRARWTRVASPGQPQLCQWRHRRRQGQMHGADLPRCPAAWPLVPHDHVRCGTHTTHISPWHHSHMQSLGKPGRARRNPSQAVHATWLAGVCTCLYCNMRRAMAPATAHWRGWAHHEGLAADC